MAEITLTAAPVLGGIDMTRAGCRLVERDDLALVSLALPQGDEAAVAQALQGGLGLAMPAPQRSVEHGGVRAVHTAPDQLMLILSEADAAALIAARTGNAGYVTVQTGAWVCLELSGPTATTALERLCMLDLDNAAFPLDAAARTVMEHISAILIRTAADTYLLLSASSSARSFLHALETSLRNIGD